MSRRLFTVAGVALVLLGLVYVAWPAGHIPPYDANLVRLAESDLQGYCSGESFWKSEGAGSADIAAQCRTRLAHQRPNTPNLMVVQGAFCTALVDSGWQGKQPDCLAIMGDNEYWPTYDGGITNQWNRARPYPRPLISTSIGSRSSGSRTGDRTGGERQNNPTHRTPNYP